MPLSPRDRRALIVLGAVAGAALAFFLVTRLLGGEGEEVALPPTPGVSPEPPAASPTPRETPPPGVLTFTGRDPFSPPPVLVSPSPGGGVSPSPEPGEEPTEEPTTPPGPDSSATVDDHTVVLIDTFTRGGEQVAQVDVDGTIYTVAEGEAFADGFELVSVSGDCADILFGDDPFTLCVAERK